MPLPEERLAKPIELPGCPEVTIIEWKHNGAQEILTKPLPALIVELGALCRTVVDELDRRIRAAGVEPSAEFAMRLTMSVLPPGKGPRELNDVSGRMRVAGPARSETLHGSYWYGFRHAFMQNGVAKRDPSGGLTLSTEARRVFAHELFHAFVHQRGVAWHFESQGGEEQGAQEFTASMGFGR